MFLLILYISLALVVSFSCSIAEAVLLSVSPAHIALLEREGKPSGKVLRLLTQDINKPLAAILTLNTISHTVGAAGAGAQTSVVFGSAWLGAMSALLTVLILVFSEIIPKTLGAYYWKELAPSVGYGLRFLVIALAPFVYLSQKMTKGMTAEPKLTGFNRDEFLAMADISLREGQIAEQESQILKNLLLLRDMRVRDAMTPRTVVFSVSETITVKEFFDRWGKSRFSRIPVYREEAAKIEGFVLRNDLLLAQSRGNDANTVESYRRELPALLDSMSLADALTQLFRLKAHMVMVVNEYGSVEGILTLEDVMETLLGVEIIDEEDKTVNMRKLARRLWRQRAESMGIKVDFQE